MRYGLGPSTPCLKLGIDLKIPHLPALELELQGPKLKHPESFGHIYWGKLKILQFLSFLSPFSPGLTGIKGATDQMLP